MRAKINRMGMYVACLFGNSKETSSYCDVGFIEIMRDNSVKGPVIILVL